MTKKFEWLCHIKSLLTKNWWMLCSAVYWHFSKTKQRKKCTTTTTVILWPFFPLKQELAGNSTQQPSPLLPILCIFPFQPPDSMSILGLPHPLLPSTSNDMIFFTQSSFHSTYPNHLNLCCFTASDTDSILILSLSSALGTLSFR